MMAFAPPPTKSHHPGPWVPVQGGFNFEGRVEVELTKLDSFDGLSPTVVVWLIAAVLRLRVPSPIRIAVIGNTPFDKMGESAEEVHAIAFERSPHQIGTFTTRRTQASEQQLIWLRDMLPIAAQLYHDERFFRAFSVYDQAQWSTTPEIGAVLVWTAIEIIFDLSDERDKTKAICRALSDYVAADKADRDRAYQVIQNLYFKRGQTVHAGRSMAHKDISQSFRLASVAFQRILIDGKLPPSPRKTVQ